MKISFKSLDQSTWPSLAQLFGAKGACGGCWCMLWRLGNREYENNKGAGNRKLLRQLVEKHQPIGVIAFVDDQPVGWCSVSPKYSFPRLKNSRLFKSVAPSPELWSITCLFVAKEFRRQGLSSRLVKAAAKFAFQHGAHTVESYPIIAKTKIADAFAWVGLTECYRKAGFVEVQQPSESRRLMQLKKGG